MSKIWTLDNVKKAIEGSVSYADTLRKLKLDPGSGGHYNTLKRKIKKWDLNISHFTNKPKTPPKSKIPTEDILVESSNYKGGTHKIKLRLISEGLLTEVCSVCQGTEWRGQTIPLQLDHINGIRNDNRLENLRLLCPNCHALTETYAGKNCKKPDNKCSDCNQVINRRSTRCSSCYHKSRKSG